MRKEKWIRKGFALFLAAAMTVTTGIPVQAWEEVETMAEDTQNVNIPDEVLKSLLVSGGEVKDGEWKNWDSNNDGELSVAEMQGITDIYFPGSADITIAELTGLEYAVNLKSLVLTDYGLTDISALGKLVNLEKIDLGGNNITSFDAIKSNKNLEVISMRDNPVSDISFLGEYTGLRYVNVSNTQVSDISTLKNSVETLEVLVANNSQVTKEMFFDVYIADTHTIDVSVGNIYTLDNRLPYLQGWNLVDGELVKEDIACISSNKEVAEVVYRDDDEDSGWYVQAKKVGTTDISVKLGNKTKTYAVTVKPQPKPVEAGEERSADYEVVTDAVGGFGTILDEKDTLWTINKDNSEKVQANVTNYISKVVYANPDKGDKEGMWMEYYTLDENNSVWHTGKESQDSGYKAEKLFDNVASYNIKYSLTTAGELYSNATKQRVLPNVKVAEYDWSFALGEDGKVYRIKDGIVLAENVKKYFDAWEDIGRIYLGTDNKVHDKTSGTTWGSNVKDILWIGYVNDVGEVWGYVENNKLYLLRELNGEVVSCGVNPIENVENVIDAYITGNNNDYMILTYKDGGFGTACLQGVPGENDSPLTLEYKKISDSALKMQYINFYLDEAGKLWSVTVKNSKLSVEKIMENVREIGCLGGRISVAVTTDNKMYCLFDEATGKWSQAAENVAKIGWTYEDYYGYYLGTDGVLYEILKEVDGKSLETQKIMSDVKDMSVGGGRVYIIRTDGSVWQYDGFRGDRYHGAPEMAISGEDLGVSITQSDFADVTDGAWYNNAINYVNSYSLMTGLNETTFGPAQNLARAQFAVIIHRMNGAPKMAYSDRFPDVREGDWYTDAVMWASSEEVNVIKGYDSNGLFGSADNITREQMAVMMYRYANFLGADTSKKADFSKFSDAARVSDFAKEAMQWAVGNGIITGKDNETRIDPQGNANRAECATIIMRFHQKYS